MTKKTDYTQLTGLRVIPNRDTATPDGQRNNQNIGIGIPNYTLASLPLDEISKTGDLAWVTDQNGFYKFDNGAWSPVLTPAALALAPEYAGAYQRNGSTSAMVLSYNVPQEILWNYSLVPESLSPIRPVNSNYTEVPLDPTGGPTTCVTALGLLAVPGDVQDRPVQAFFGMSFIVTNVDGAGENYTISMEYENRTDDPGVFLPFCSAASVHSPVLNRGNNVNLFGYQNLLSNKEYFIRVRIVCTTNVDHFNNITISSLNLMLNTL